VDTSCELLVWEYREKSAFLISPYIIKTKFCNNFHNSTSYMFIFTLRPTVRMFFKHPIYIVKSIIRYCDMTFTSSVTRSLDLTKNSAAFSSSCVLSSWKMGVSALIIVFGWFSLCVSPDIIFLSVSLEF